MNLKEFRKIRSLTPKRLYCPMCKKWEKANVLKWEELEENTVRIIHNCELGLFKGTFEFLYSEAPEIDEIEIEQKDSCFIKSHYDMNKVTANDLTLDKNQLLIPQTLKKTNTFCEKNCISCCMLFNSDDYTYKCKFIIEYDENELKEAGILGEETSKEKDLKQEEQAKKENVEQKEKEQAKKEDAECEEKQEEKNMANAVEKVGIAASTLDINKISKDLGINFGLNTDTRIQSTILGSVFEYEEGRYRGFDREKCTVTDYAQIKPINLPSILLPSTTVKVGEMVIHNKEAFFITKAEEGNVWGANPITLKEEKLLPVLNPIGIRCYTRVIALGEILGFNGETNQNTKIILWLMTMMANKVFEGGIDSANEKIKNFTSKGEKYAELLVPFGCVAFATYAIKGEDLRGTNISKTVKDTFGIDMPELNNKNNLKRLAAIGLVTTAAITLLKGKIDKASSEEYDFNEKEATNFVEKLYNIVKPYESTIKKVLPVALAICAIKLFNGGKIEEIQEKLEGVALIVEDILHEKYGINENFFNKENLKKIAIVAGVAAVSFMAYGKKITESETKESSELKKLLKVVAPAIPVIAIFLPQIKDRMSSLFKGEDFLQDELDETESEDDSEETETAEPEEKVTEDFCEEKIKDNEKEVVKDEEKKDSETESEE